MYVCFLSIICNVTIFALNGKIIVVGFMDKRQQVYINKAKIKIGGIKMEVSFNFHFDTPDF